MLDVLHNVHAILRAAPNLVKGAAIPALRPRHKRPTHPPASSYSEVTSETFGLVVDKSTVDAVSCGGEAAVLEMASGVRECLAPEGLWGSQ
ncbi:hypothetical protein EV127DRAFT_417607 [Xylaria flabelliformis]|nr:hypothetical protein EV127DRAFT_417607 [Xylaria flabelliformis]